MTADSNGAESENQYTPDAYDIVPETESSERMTSGLSTVSEKVAPIDAASIIGLACDSRPIRSAAAPTGNAHTTLLQRRNHSLAIMPLSQHWLDVNGLTPAGPLTA